MEEERKKRDREEEDDDRPPKDPPRGDPDVYVKPTSGRLPKTEDKGADYHEKLMQQYRDTLDELDRLVKLHPEAFQNLDYTKLMGMSTKGRVTENLIKEARVLVQKARNLRTEAHMVAFYGPVTFTKEVGKRPHGDYPVPGGGALAGREIKNLRRESGGEADRWSYLTKVKRDELGGKTIEKMVDEEVHREVLDRLKQFKDDVVQVQRVHQAKVDMAKMVRVLVEDDALYDVIDDIQRTLEVDIPDDPDAETIYVPRLPRPSDYHMPWRVPPVRFRDNDIDGQSGYVVREATRRVFRDWGFKENDAAQNHLVLTRMYAMAKKRFVPMRDTGIAGHYVLAAEHEYIKDQLRMFVRLWEEYEGGDVKVLPELLRIHTTWMDYMYNVEVDRIISELQIETDPRKPLYDELDSMDMRLAPLQKELLVRRHRLNLPRLPYDEINHEFPLLDEPTVRALEYKDYTYRLQTVLCNGPPVVLLDFYTKGPTVAWLDDEPKWVTTNEPVLAEQTFENITPLHQVNTHEDKQRMLSQELSNRWRKERVLLPVTTKPEEMEQFLMESQRLYEEEERRINLLQRYARAKGSGELTHEKAAALTEADVIAAERDVRMKREAEKASAGDQVMFPVIAEHIKERYARARKALKNAAVSEQDADKSIAELAEERKKALQKLIDDEAQALADIPKDYAGRGTLLQETIPMLPKRRQSYWGSGEPMIFETYEARRRWENDQRQRLDDLRFQDMETLLNKGVAQLQAMVLSRDEFNERRASAMRRGAARARIWNQVSAHDEVPEHVLMRYMSEIYGMHPRDDLPDEIRKKLGSVVVHVKRRFPLVDAHKLILSMVDSIMKKYTGSLANYVENAMTLMDEYASSEHEHRRNQLHTRYVRSGINFWCHLDQPNPDLALLDRLLNEETRKFKSMAKAKVDARQSRTRLSSKFNASNRKYAHMLVHAFLQLGIVAATLRDAGVAERDNWALTRFNALSEFMRETSGRRRYFTGMIRKSMKHYKAVGSRWFRTMDLDDRLFSGWLYDAVPVVAPRPAQESSPEPDVESVYSSVHSDTDVSDDSEFDE